MAKIQLQRLATQIWKDLIPCWQFIMVPRTLTGNKCHNAWPRRKKVLPTLQWQFPSLILRSSNKTCRILQHHYLNHFSLRKFFLQSGVQHLLSTFEQLSAIVICAQILRWPNLRTMVSLYEWPTWHPCICLAPSSRGHGQKPWGSLGCSRSTIK